MKTRIPSLLSGAVALALTLPAIVSAQGWEVPPPGRFGGGPGSFGGGEIAVVGRFDRDGDGRLDTAERKEARSYLESSGVGRRRGRGGGYAAAAQPGQRLSPADVKPAGDAPLYDPGVVRTLFLQFENDDWESEMEAFNDTDVEVPAQLVVDGRTYRDVGVHFRGASSYRNVSTGQKRSLNLSIDFVHDDQRLLGYRTLNLLNSHLDPTFLRSVLYYQIAREYIAAYRANHVRVVINGENWGVYVNVQQFNKDMVGEWFDGNDGARWKVPGTPRGRGGLNYLGDDIEPYRAVYEIKSRDKDESWQALIRLCRVLNQTRPEQLEEALAPILDVDGALKFLAIENALINSDGYWTRASDYNLYCDESGVFHLVPHDANETLREPEGPGMGWRGGSSGSDLDPLVNMGDLSKPLLGRLLASSVLRERYLGYVRDIARDWLDWNRLGPIAERYQSLIDPYVRDDTRRLDSYGNFQRGLTEHTASNGLRGQEWLISLKDFADQRRAYLLAYPAIKALDK